MIAMTEQAPSVGRIVHYCSPGSGDGVYPQTCRAAVVVEVDKAANLVTLMVINPTGIHFRERVMQDPGHVTDSSAVRSSYTWHWPERV